MGHGTVHRTVHRPFTCQNRTTNYSMEKTLTLLITCSFAFPATAQPTLTFATNGPMLGTEYTLNYGNYVPPGSAGAMQAWDLSGLQSDSSDAVEMVAPSSTINGSAFTTATVAEVSSPVTTFYQVDANGIHFAGSDDGTSLIVNDPLPTHLPFPCTMGSSWTSPHAAMFEFDGNDVFRSGTISGAADGYGTLTMPWGTVPNVLRIHLTNIMQDSLVLFTMDYTYDSYLYYVAGQSYPIAELVTATIDMGFGMPDTVHFSRWTGALTMGTEAPGVVGGSMHAFPNPATDGVNIVVTEDFAADPTVTVLDAAGRVVHQQGLLVKSGNTAPLDMSMLAPGTYTLVIVDRKGLRATAQVVLR